MPYYDGEACVTFDDADSYKDLMLKSVFENFKDNKYLMPIPKFKLMGQIDEKDEKVTIELKKRDSLENSQKIEIKKWAKVNKINFNDNWAIKNKFLFTNFILIKSKQEFAYQKYFSPNNFNLNTISGTYDYYNLSPKDQYKFFIKYCIDEKVYKYLSKNQKKKLNGYKPFVGNLERNVLIWEP